MNEKFTLRDKSNTDSVEVNNYTAYFPESKNFQEKYEIPKYVKIVKDGKWRIFETKIRTAAMADDIIVSNNNLKIFGGRQQNVTVDEVGFFRYWAYSFFHYNLWTFIGFAVALSGVIIDGLLKIGDAGYGIDCTRQTIIVLKVLSFLLTIGGTITLFIRALAKK